MAAALVLSACGGGESSVASTAAADAAEEAGASVEETAAANIELLEPADDARDVEVLAVQDGSISTLRAAVDGDRPVLLWFWAPH